MSARLLAVFSALSLAGCGARSELASSSGAGGSSSATSMVSSTASTAASTSSAGGGGSGGGPCTWGFGPVVELAGKHEYLSGAVTDGDHLLLFTDEHPNCAARSLSFDLETEGAPHLLPIHFDGNFLPTFVAGPGGALAIRSEEDGSAVVPVGADGSPLGAVQKTSEGPCIAATATSSGFLAIAGTYVGSPYAVDAPLDALLFDTSGALVATKPAVVPASPSLVALHVMTVALDDGSVLVFWSNEQAKVNVQHLSAAGDPLTPPKELLPDYVGVRALSVGSSALLVWNDGKNFAENSIHAATLDASLNLGPEVVVVPAPTQAFVVALVDGGPGPGKLLVTATGDAYDQPVAAQWISAAGAALGPPFTSQIDYDIDYPTIVGTPAGPVVIGRTTAQRVVCQ